MRSIITLGFGSLLCIGMIGCTGGDQNEGAGGMGGAAAGAGGKISSSTTGAVSSGTTASTGSSTTGAATSSSSAASSSSSSSSAASSSSSSSSVASSSSSSSSSAASSSSSSSSAASSSSSGGPSGCLDTSATAGTLTQQFAGATLSAQNGKTYYLQSNWWHLFANETEPYNGLSFTMNNPQNAAVPQGDNSPMGFPSMFIGQYAGHTTSGSNLPKQVSAIMSIPTIFKTNNSAIGTSNHNATYDVWFTQNGNPLGPNQSNPGAGGAYLMVWLFKPTNRQPRGSDAGHMGQAVAGIPGTWDVWIDNVNPPCISYVSTNPIDGLDFDLKDFIADAVSKNYGITNNMYLSIVFAGFEVWGGANGLQVKQFCAAVK